MTKLACMLHEMRRVRHRRKQLLQLVGQAGTICGHVARFANRVSKFLNTVAKIATGLEKVALALHGGAAKAAKSQAKKAARQKQLEAERQKRMTQQEPVHEEPQEAAATPPYTASSTNGNIQASPTGGMTALKDCYPEAAIPARSRECWDAECKTMCWPGVQLQALGMHVGMLAVLQALDVTSPASLAMA